MKFFVTGGNGFIGRRLVEQLSRQGHNLKVLSRHSDSILSSGVQAVRGDLTSDSHSLDKLVDGCEIIFHCAGEIRNEAAMKSLHVDGTQRLMDAVLKQAKLTGKAIHWVQLSSVGAYGPPAGAASSERIVTEDTLLQPVGEYEVTKTLSDKLIIEASEGDLITYSIIRPSNVFGFGMPNESLFSLGEMVRRGLFFYIGKPGAIATYVHVSDVVEVLLRCCKDQRAKGEIFNISNDCLLEEMINGIADAHGVDHPRFRLSEKLMRTVVKTVGKIVPLPLTDKRINAIVVRTKYPCDKLKQKLNFVPKVSVPSALGEVVCLKDGK